MPERRKRSNWEITKEVIIAALVTSAIGIYSWSRTVDRSIIVIDNRVDNIEEKLDHLEKLEDKMNVIAIDVGIIKGLLINKEDEDQ